MRYNDLVSIEEAQDRMDQEPTPGTVYLRKAYDKLPPMYLRGGYGDLFWSLNRIYRCLDKYSDEQRVQLQGAFLTVWAHNQLTSAYCSLLPGDDLAKAIAVTYLVALQSCPHRHAKEVYSTRRGYHEYECQDCGRDFVVDSSD